MAHFNLEWYNYISAEINYKRPFMGNSEHLQQI
jgi:hypothetical protein